MSLVIPTLGKWRLEEQEEFRVILGCLASQSPAGATEHPEWKYTHAHTHTTWALADLTRVHTFCLSDHSARGLS